MSIVPARTPFDLAQTYSGASQAAIEKFIQEHPEYQQLIREEPTSEGMEALAGMAAATGIAKTAEAAAKGVARGIGKLVGIDTAKQTWSWENFKDAWVNHTVETFAAVLPFVAWFLKSKGITPSETQVRELVDSAVRGEKTPLAQELKNELEKGPPHEAPVSQSQVAEPRAVERPAEASASMDEVGPQEMEKAPLKDDLDLAKNSEDAQQSVGRSSGAEGTGLYEDVRGHHVFAKSGFRGHPAYDPQKGFSISQEFMENHGWRHRDMTLAQRQLFHELAASGRPNTLAEHTRIAVEALKAGGATEVEAKAIVSQALDDLGEQDITAPTRIPWEQYK